MKPVHRGLLRRLPLFRSALGTALSLGLLAGTTLPLPAHATGDAPATAPAAGQPETAPGPATAPRGPITVTDVLGRQVTLKAPARRIILTQARHMPVLALLTPDPVSLLAGWSDEYRTSFANEYRNYLARFPAIAKVPVVGRHTADSFSVEKTLALRPDLVVLTARFAGGTDRQSVEDSLLMKRLTAAGVPVIVVDFFVKPLENTAPSLLALGQAIGEEARTREFLDFYRQGMDEVKKRLADVPASDRPPVFVHAHAGSTDCCNSPGTGTFNEMISYAGGNNIGADAIKTVTGRLSFEYINSRNPQVYVATGTGAGKRASDGLVIGTGVDPAAARQSLQGIIAANRLTALSAIRSGNAHGIWHAFNDSPLHVIFIQALAGWLHPERFRDLPAQKTLDEVNRRFLTVPLQGTYMVDLKAQPTTGQR